MIERGDVRKDQLLLRHINVVDVGTVYNQTFADADKHISLRSELRGNHFFDLPELIR